MRAYPRDKGHLMPSRNIISISLITTEKSLHKQKAINTSFGVISMNYSGEDKIHCDRILTHHIKNSLCLLSSNWIDTEKRASSTNQYRLKKSRDRITDYKGYTKNYISNSNSSVFFLNQGCITFWSISRIKWYLKIF